MREHESELLIAAQELVDLWNDADTWCAHEGDVGGYFARLEAAIQKERSLPPELPPEPEERPHR